MGNRKCRCDRLGVVASVVAIMLVALAGQTLRAAAPPAGTATVITPAGGFDIDGDLIANTPTPNIGDWLPSVPPGLGGSVLDAAGNTLLTNGFTFHIIDPYDNTDNNFGGGDKVNHNPNTWGWKIDGVLDKDNINNLFLHITKDTNNPPHWWAIVAADRQKENGTSYIDFEFLQNTLTTNAGGFISTGPNCGRTTNDFLLTIPLSNGGNVPNFYFQKWLYVGSGNNCEGYDYVNDTNPVPVYAAVNATNITGLPFSAFGGTTYASNTFAEAAVDLTALIAGTDPCNSIGVKTIFVKTKSSASSEANIFDFIWPIQVNFTIGLAADAGPDQTKCNTAAGANQTCASFDLVGKGEPGINGIATMQWVATGSNNVGTAFSGAVAECIGNGCPKDVNGNSLLSTTVSFCAADPTKPASLTMSLLVKDSQNCYRTNDLVLTVNPSSPCAVNYEGDDTVCPGTTGLSFSKVSPVAGETYAWTVVGGTIAAGGTKDDNFVQVDASSNCSSTLTVSLVVTNGSGCLSTKCEQTITVEDKTPPSITCPTGLVIECADADQASKIAAWLASVTGSDTCGTVSFTNNYAVGRFSNGCGNTGAQTVTFGASDECGNWATCTATITIEDKTPPSISCPTGLVIECADADQASKIAAWLASVGGSDSCGTVSFTNNYALGRFSDLCGNTGAQTVTFGASDACGNWATCTATVTIRDTTPPSITTCPPTITSGDSCAVVLKLPISTTGATITYSEFVAEGGSASDTCSGVTVSYEDEYKSQSCPIEILRTFTVEDACENQTKCEQTIKFDDTAPPTVSCPTNATIEGCDSSVISPAVGGGTITLAQFIALGGTATDSCGLQTTVNYSDESLIPTGCEKAKVKRTFTVRDICDNPSTCQQTITVRDTILPVIDSVPTGGELGCRLPPTDETIEGLVEATDNCPGTPAIDVSHRDSTNGCDITRIMTITASDACGNKSESKTVTYTFTRDSGGPSISLPAYEAFYCPEDDVVIGPPTVLDDCEVVSMTVVVTNGAGVNVAGPYVLVGSTWTPSWPAMFDLPTGSFGFVVTAVDKCGNTSTKSFKIRVLDDCSTHCTFTQGFYGNNSKGKGKFSWMDQTYTKSALVNALLGTNGIVIGTTNTGKYLKIAAGEADCIDARLPAGGPSAALEAGFGFTTDDTCGIVLKTGAGSLPLDKQGRKFRNNLLGQTITLSLNLRLDPTLSVFHLQSTLCTVGEGGSITSKTIPASVLAKLGSKNTVQDLLDLANKALGGDASLSGMLSDIGSAASAVNEAFDECRVAVPCDL